jgi:hypothetical protein
MIRILLLLVITASVLALAASDQPARPTPLVHAIDPLTAKAGAQLAATGENLGKDCVAEVYLTQGEKTFKVEIKEQISSSITFVVPATLKAGRFGFMVLTRGPVPAFLDEPVIVTIE